MKNKNKQLAFTLLEMSLTIVIVGIVLITGINFQMSLRESSAKNLTTEKLKRIEKSINDYILTNGRLPCTASLLITNDSPEFGKELRDSSGNCTQTNNSFLNSSEKIIYGALPTKVLNLTNDYGMDNWKSRLIYIMKKDYGTKNGFLKSDGNSLTIKNLNNKIVTNKAIYLVISSGENKNGAFINGKQIAINNSLEDKENVFISGFDKIFIKDIQRDLFDDIIYYKEKKDIILHLGLEDNLCSLEALGELDNAWKGATNINCNNDLCQQLTEVISAISCSGNDFSKNTTGEYNRPVRKCLKYGYWSDIMYPCVQGCGLSNIFTLNKGNFYKSGDPESSISINVKYLKRIKFNEENVFKCIGNKVGYVKLKCSQVEATNEGKWEYIAGECINKS